jgi:NAD(P)-dependent dehydrogenase (short-subunit alcohol dehydrogenase family)
LNKTALITGGSSGLGLASAEALAKESFDLILVARGEQRLRTETARLRNEFPQIEIKDFILDMSNQSAVRDFAKNIASPLDVLMNNAGLMGPDYALSPEGIESQMATNHIGHFLLTSLLWSNLEEAKGRVVSISSVVHRRSKMQAESKEEIQGKTESYNRWGRYADSKLACLLFARELDIRAKQLGSKVLSIAAHPGWALTGLQANYPNTFDFLAQKAAVGARSQIRAALDPALRGGEFIGPRLEAWGEPKLIAGSKHSKDLELAQRLWKYSEELTSSKFLG